MLRKEHPLPTVKPEQPDLSDVHIDVRVARHQHIINSQLRQITLHNDQRTRGTHPTVMVHREARCRRQGPTASAADQFCRRLGAS